MERKEQAAERERDWNWKKQSTMEDEEKKRDVVKDKSEALTKHKRSKRNQNEILRKMQKVRRKMNWR